MDHSTLPLFSLQLETKEIPLSQGKVAIVDAADYDFLMQWKWSAWQPKHAKTFYAVRSAYMPNGKQHLFQMHREILGTQPGEQVDHKDCDGLNNTRENLRSCTNQENNWNKGPHRDNTSGYKGVSWYSPTGKWRARIAIGGRAKFLGYYLSPEEAAYAYDAAAKELFGEFARTNF